MKRKRHSDLERAEAIPLGATEFCSILGGDDPRVILRGLRRFADIVITERNLALGTSLASHDDDEINAHDRLNDENEDDDSIGAEIVENWNKRTKKEDESWKEDTANYNVPFVGTSVSSSKDKGVIIKNQWPCGILLAYLEKSPLAVELTDGRFLPGTSEGAGHVHKTLTRTKKLKAAAKLTEYYLKALAELVTCAIPIARLRIEIYEQEEQQQDDSPQTSQHTGVIAHILKKRLGDLFDLLRVETLGGKGQSSVEGGCGPSAPHVLNVLIRLALSGVATARHLVRSFEQQRLPEAVLRFLVKQPNKPSQEITARDKSRECLLRLVAILLSYGDPIITNCIMTTGTTTSKDEKLSAGLLYLVCKEAFGLSKTLVSNTKLQFAHLLSMILRLIRRTLLLHSRKEQALRRQSLLQLLSRDFITALVQLSLLSPMPKDTNSIMEALDEVNVSHLDPMENIAKTAQGFIYTLVANKKESPLLGAMEIHFPSGFPPLLRILNSLLDGATSGLAEQSLVLRCLQQSPVLIPEVFATMDLPDLKNHFAVIARLHVMSKIIQYGSLPVKCFSVQEANPSVPNLIMKALLPASLKRHIFAKLLQSSNSLVVAEALRLLVCVLRRLKGCTEDKDWRKDITGTILDRFVQERMPEIHIIVAILQAYGPASASTPNPILFTRASDVLVEAASIQSMRWQEKSYDLLKLVPSEERMLRSSVYLQSKLMGTLYKLLCLQKEDSTRSANSTAPLFRFMMQAKTRSAYQVSRKILILILSRRDDASGCLPEYLHHESTCWVDGMHKDCLDEFFQVLKSTTLSSVGVRGWVECAKIWQETGVSVTPSSPASSLLLHSLRALKDASLEFRKLICQVAARSIAYRQEPLPLAAVVASKVGHFLGSDAINQDGESLVEESRLREYGTSLQTKKSITPLDVFKFLSSFLPTTSWLINIIKPDKGTSTKEDFIATKGDLETAVGDLNVTTKYIEHCVVATQGGEKFYELYRRSLVPMTCYRSLLFEKYAFPPVQSKHFSEIGRLISKKSLAQLSIAHGACQGSILRKEWMMDVVDSGISSCSTRVTMLTWFVTAFICAHDALRERLLSLLGLMLKSPTALYPVIAPCVICHVERIANETSDFKFDEHDEALVNALFRVWAGLAFDDDVGVLVSVQGALRSILGSKSTQSFNLCLLLESLPPKQVITKSLEIESRNIQYLNSWKRFSTLLIEVDYCRYSEATIDLLLSQDAETSSSKPKTELLASESLPAALEYFDDLRIPTRDKIKAAGVILKAASWMIYSTSDLTKTSILDAILCIRVDTLSLCPAEYLVDIFETLCAAVLKSSVLEIKTLSLATHLFRAYSTIDFDPGKLKAMGSTVLSSLCSSIERLFRLTKTETACPSDLDKSSEALDLLCKLWTYSSERKTGIVSHENISLFCVVIRSCAKYGLRPGFKSREGHAIRLQCFQLILMSVSTQSNLQLSDLLGKPFGVLVFQWITSHSNFSDILSKDASFALKEPLLRILLSSYTANSEHIRFDCETWSTILSGYNAGMTCSDVLARRLLFLYSQSADNHAICQIDNLRWGTRRASHFGRSNWEWLPAWIELPRIVATLERFPFADRLEPTSPDGSRESFGSSDSRYAPGFLLPLILALLEEQTQNKTRRDVVGTKSAHRRNGEESTLLLQKLFEKGAVALALGSLCCLCQGIRRVAIAILSHVNVLIRLDDALMLSSWRERPQLVLIMDSVRRALVRDIALCPGVAEVPLIPPSCAVFVAKASLVLASPRDDVYSSVNRYFLRIDTDHGALQDFNRLPAFVPMFCSSTTADGLSLKERCWAVETLRDGFINETCFGPLMGCHAFELLLTRLELTVHSGNDLEFGALVSAVCRVVECSGKLGLSHLICRLGLLSWLGSLLTTRRVLQASARRLCDLLNILSLVLEKARSVLELKEIAMEVRGLPDAVMNSLTERIGSSNDNDTVLVWVPLRRFVYHLSRLFPDTVNAINMLSGIKASAATLFLTAKDDGCQQEKLDSICTTALLQVDKYDVRGAVEFCTAVLRTLLSVERLEAVICSKSIRCVRYVVNVIHPTIGANSAELSETIKAVRCLCCKWPESRKVWHEVATVLRM
ncbi:hypothetical protein ACA910_005082 [Epithemia clementina (nom. ined.)]